MLREHVEREEALEATDKATTDLASYHKCVDVERVDYVLVEQLLKFLYSEGDFAGAQVLLNFLDNCVRIHVDSHVWTWTRSLREKLLSMRMGTEY